MQPFLIRDLVRLENQISFFVLQCLFHISVLPGEEGGPSLVKLVQTFFNGAMTMPEVLDKYHDPKPLHLLDL